MEKYQTVQRYYAVPVSGSVANFWRLGDLAR